MASVNRVTIVGNLGRDPEIRYLPSGDPIANIAVATTSKWKDKSGQPQSETEWHRVSAFGKLAEIIGQWLKKGSSVYIEGKLKTRKYADKDGIERYATEIIADQMQMLGGRQDEQKQSEPRQTSKPVQGYQGGTGKPDDHFDEAINNLDDDIPF